MGNKLLTIAFLSLGYSLFCQTKEHQIYYRNNSFQFTLPADFVSHHFNYSEGDYYSFYRLDSVAKRDTTSLTFQFGSNVQLPHLNDLSFIIEKESKKQRSGKQLNGRYWRELNLYRDINIYYKDASKSEKVLFDSLIWKFRHQNDLIPLTNTIKNDAQNLYTYAINILIDSLSENYKAIFILQGEPAQNVNTRLLSEHALNAEKSRVFNEKLKLTNDFKYLIGQDLIRLKLGPVCIEESNVRFGVWLYKTVYKSKGKLESKIFDDGLWSFEFKFNSENNSFELDRISRGILL